MKKTKKTRKEALKQLFQIIITVIITSTISVSAASVMIESRSIVYRDNGNVSNVQEALDTLYSSVEVTTILPVGSVIPYMGTTAPTNYLICDGAEYNINDYKKLADHIKNDFGSYNFFGGNGTTTFAVPDLRGEFLRGTGTNSHSNQGDGSNVGVHQDSTQLPNYWGSISTAVMAVSKTSISNVDKTVGTSAKMRYSSTSDTSSAYANSYTIRPTNTSVNYIIKTK